MSATPFADLYGDGLDKALSSSDRLNLFTTAKRKAEINAAVEWFVTQTECVIRNVTLAITDNTSTLNLRTLVTNADLLWIAKRGPQVRLTRTSDGYVTTIAGKDLPRTSIEILDRDVPNWQAETMATPRGWYLYNDGGEEYFGLFPPMQVSTGYTASLVLPYVVRPATMTADADVPFTVTGGNPDLTLSPWYDGVVFKAASELELLRKDLNRSQALNQLAMGRVMDYLDKQRVPGGKSIQMPNLRPRSRWQAPRTVRETVTS